ncbi:MAG: thioredoxin domain-containing protein, partial [Proteobacteria bacterium]|nr:thioredoxin domain-containing protein [Pseudomonadota bacterium]
ILGMPYKGVADAPVTIIEYSDFQCPFCKRASQTVDELLKLPEYQGKIKVVFKQLPLEFHENAHRAAEAAMFAHDKGMFAHDRDKFWQMHDIMFEHSDALSEDDLLNYAEKIGLSRSELKAALDSGKFKEIVDEQAREANRLGLKGTPSFLINGEQLLGAQPLEKFKAKVDEALRKAQ